MIRMVLALTVDSDEQEPIGVYANLQDAVDGVIADERSRCEEHELAGFDEDLVAEFRENMEEAVEQQHGAPYLDIVFESGFGSWDIRFVEVKVFSESA